MEIDATRESEPPACNSGLAGIPENLWEENLKVQLADILQFLLSCDYKTRLFGLKKLSCLLGEFEEHPSLEMPMLGRVVFITCLCALDWECANEAATVLCRMLPIVRRSDDALWHTQWGFNNIHRALLAMDFNRPGPAFFYNNSPNLATVFGAYLVPKELMEGIKFLAGGDAEEAFGILDTTCLLQDIIKMFCGTSLVTQGLLEFLYASSKKRKEKNRCSAATLAFSTMTTLSLEKVAEFLLHRSFSDCEELWKIVSDIADQAELVKLLLAKMEGKPEPNPVVRHATQAVHLICFSGVKRSVLKETFPRLLLVLLWQISVSHQEHQWWLKEPLETLWLLIYSVGVREEAMNTFWDQLGSPDGFSQGLSALARVLSSGPRFWIPSAVRHLLNILTMREFPDLYDIAMIIYTELNRINCRKIDENARDALLNRLVRKLSLQGNSSLKLKSNLMEDPWSLQLILLNNLGSTKPEVIPRVMETLDRTLTMEEDASYVKILAATYSDLTGHEAAAVRAAAIKHLGLLRARRGKLWLPTTPEEAISEMVDVLVHLEDEDEVAEAAKTALRQLVPKVKWKVAPEVYELHHVLHQASEYITRSYPLELVRGAALTCMLHTNIQGEGVFKVAALFVGHLAHKKGNIIKKEDLQSYILWLESASRYDNEDQEKISCTMKIVQRAFHAHSRRGFWGLIRRCSWKCGTKPKYPPEYFE